MSDIYRDAFLKFLKDGKSPLEALREFDQEEWRNALVAELESGAVRINPKTYRAEVHDGLPSLLELGARASREQMNERDMEQAIELWLAGWTSETPHGSQQDIFSWYWRRPSRRPGKPGRKFLSTTQALNTLRREPKAK